MHAPPSVSYPVGRSAFAGRIVAALVAAGLAALLAWSLQAPFGARQAAGFLVLAACAALAWRAWLHSPVGVLHWDGLGWTWEQGGQVAAGRPELALDLQSRLLLRWTGEDGGRRWLWAERSSALSHWEALRRAVYSRASMPLPAAGKPPAAEQ